MHRCSPYVVLGIVALLWTQSAMLRAQSVEANANEETVRSAVFLLRQATRVHRDGRHNTLLRALRHLGDPQLSPLMSALAESAHPVLTTHGILGLAECNSDKKLDLVRIASIKDAAVLAQLISAAMDSHLLSDEQADQLVNWPGLDIAVKVLISCQLVQNDKFNKLEVLHQAVQSNNLARRHLADLLLVQLGDTKAPKRLEQLNTSEDERRDRIRRMLLRAAVRYELERAGPWAMGVAMEPGVNLALGMLALKVALRFGVPDVDELFRQRIESADDRVQRVRLALVGLDVAPWVRPELFDVLIQQNERVLQRIGTAGRAIASQMHVADSVVQLIAIHRSHAPIQNWALGYAGGQATPADAKVILLELIRAFRDGPERGRARRLNIAVLAAQTLFERTGQDADELLRPMLASPQTDPVLVRGILLGLIRSVEPNPHKLVIDLPRLEDRTARQLALLLEAKHSARLSPSKLKRLALVVRGGGIADDALRIQAAGSFLRLTHQTKRALDEVFSP